jgi:hypothetical protein
MVIFSSSPGLRALLAQPSRTGLGSVRKQAADRALGQQIMGDAPADNGGKNRNYSDSTNPIPTVFGIYNGNSRDAIVRSNRGNEKLEMMSFEGRAHYDRTLSALFTIVPSVARMTSRAATAPPIIAPVKPPLKA